MANLVAVVHEQVNEEVHEIRQPVITRHVHTHDVYHRELPVIETEVLPARHFKPSDDGKGLVEISEAEIPQRGSRAYQPSYRIETLNPRGPPPGVPPPRIPPSIPDRHQSRPRARASSEKRASRPRAPLASSVGQHQAGMDDGDVSSESSQGEADLLFDERALSGGFLPGLHASDVRDPFVETGTAGGMAGGMASGKGTESRQSRIRFDEATRSGMSGRTRRSSSGASSGSGGGSGGGGGGGRGRMNARIRELNARLKEMGV